MLPFFAASVRRCLENETLCFALTRTFSDRLFSFRLPGRKKCNFVSVLSSFFVCWLRVCLSGYTLRC